MAKVTIKKEAWKCNRCEHIWEQKIATEIGKPFVCPKCKSPKWDVEIKRDANLGENE